MMKRTLLAMTFAGLFSTSAIASDNSDWKEDSKDAWIDGKAEATLLFNNSLNSFDINTDVNKGIVTLTGQVDNDVERELAEELIVGIDGVNEVQNKLSVKDDYQEDSMQTSQIVDAKINTVITSRYLFSSEVSGTDIDVDVDSGVVTLNGEVSSSEEKQLAIEIAKNTDDVMEVKDNLSITSSS